MIATPSRRRIFHECFIAVHSTLCSCIVTFVFTYEEKDIPPPEGPYASHDVLDTVDTVGTADTVDAIDNLVQINTVDMIRKHDMRCSRYSSNNRYGIKSRYNRFTVDRIEGFNLKRVRLNLAC